ncbi:hypothetical protein [Petroclostridium sp. X23]|uniref:hypothetical protein n=1 Tax=Petroclostridium sp. X23 TaxID=3045146 RepID=UPI0024AE6BA9|nr:hypothetical protein [Petroclostridium sp. X23]WHH59170.1 hypothetical protein QKW49_25850 [Petroclostridium sp. X23]
MTIGEFLVKIGGDTTDLDNKMDRTVKKLDTFGGQINRVTSYVRAAFAGYAGKKLFDFTVGSNADFEQYTTSFEVLLGSVDRAREHMQYLFDYAAHTPFELPQVIEASKLLETFGLETQQYLTQIGNTASAFNVPMTQVADAIGRLSAGQTGEAMEQLRRLGISAKQLGEMDIEFDKGGQLKTSISKTMDAVLAIMDKKYQGMMDEQSKTFNGLFSTLSDNLQAFGRKVGDDVFDKLKGKLEEFMAAWDQWSSDGTIDRVAEDFGTFLVNVVENVSKAIRLIAEYGKEIVVLTGAIVGLTTALKIAATVQAAFNVTAAANPYIALAAGIAAVTGGILAYNYMAKESEKVTYAQIAAERKQISETDKLLSQYDELQTKVSQNKVKGEELESAKKKLHEIEKKLAEIFPDVADGIDQENQKYATQIGLINDLNEIKKKEHLESIRRLQVESSAQMPYLNALLNSTNISLKNAETMMENSKSEYEKNQLSLSQYQRQKSAKEYTDAMAKVNELKAEKARIEAEMSKYKNAMLEVTVSEYMANNSLPPELQHFLNLDGSDLYSDKSSENGKDGKDKDGKGTGSGSYENEALDSALRILEHKKRMNQLTLEDELNMLAVIKAAYAKTSDEIMNLDEEMYAISKEIKDKRLQDSVDWINERKSLNEMSIEEEIEAWTRVYENQKDNLEAINTAAVNLYRLRKELIQQELEEAETALDKRAKDSNDWIEEQKLYGQLSELEEIAAYNRMIQYHKEYLNKIMQDEKIAQQDKDRINEEEQDTIRDLEYKKYNIRKEFLEKQVNEYIEAKRKQYDAEEAEEEKRLNDKLKAVDREYEDLEYEQKEEQRAEKLVELRKKEQLYLNAVTEQGNETLKEIQAQINEIILEQEQDKREIEKRDRKDAIEEEIEDNREKYDKLRDDLDTEQDAMLSSIAQFAKENTAIFTNANQNFSNGLLRSMQIFESQMDKQMSSGLAKLQRFVSEYNKIASELQNMTTAVEMQASSVTASAGSSSSSSKSVNVVLNDYGDKNINSKDDTIDYTQELFNTATNAVRAAGGLSG